MLDEKLREEALRAHRRPQPLIEAGMWLAASEHVHAMMDVSDGLSTDLARMCAQSQCAAQIEDVPIARSAQAMADLRGEDAGSYALAGGEDYELLVAIAPRAFAYLSSRFAKRFGHPLYAVGQFREGSGLFVRKGDAEESVTPTGWDHFA
jgi:thiamine-monophosphate kinase